LSCFAINSLFSSSLIVLLQQITVCFQNKDQEEHFLKTLSQILVLHEQDVQLLGHQVKHILLHIIWKGAIFYLSGALFGPQNTAVCVCAGWTMG